MRIRNDIRDDERRSSPFYLGLLLSVVLHAVFLIAKRYDMPVPGPEYNTPIEVADLPPEMMEPPATQPKPVPPPSNDKQVVETEKADNDKIDPKAKYLSEHNQSADKQTRAKQIDDFRKQQGTGGKGLVTKKEEYIPPTGEKAGEKADEGKQADNGDGKPDTLAPDEDSLVQADAGKGEKKEKAGGGVKRDWKTLSLKDLSVNGDGAATAASDDDLRDVQQGDRTILSTREFRYFSYYNRIKELLRQYWKPNVERQIARLWGKGKQVNDDELVTRVLVLLDGEGKIQKISRIATSGISEIDEAAVEAFQRAGPFPNPPKGIVEDDGFVRIRWDFILKTEAAPRIQFQSAGQGQAANPR